MELRIALASARASAILPALPSPLSARRLIASGLLASCAAAPPPIPLGPATEAPPPAAATPASISRDQPAGSVAPGSLPAAATSAAVPLTFERAAPDGRWILSCQARADTDGNGVIDVVMKPNGELGGDELARYLTFDSGSELVIDSLLAYSGDGRWVVIEQAGRSELLDTVSSARLDLSALGADTRRLAGPRSAHRTLAFDGDRFFYVRGSRAWELVERQLGSGAERVLARGSEPLRRFSLDAAGSLIVLELGSAEPGHKPESDWPYPTESGKESCQGPVARYLAPRPSAVAPSYLVIDRDTTEVVRADDFAAAYGKTILRRDPDGTLFALSASSRRVFADRDCAGRILWMDAARDELLVGCALPKKPGRLGVELIAHATRTPLEIDVAQLVFDEPARPSERLVPLYPGADVVIFDAEKRLLHRLKSGDAVLATRGPKALLRRARALLLFDAGTGAVTPLGGTLDPLGDALVGASLALVSPLLVELGSGAVRGSIPGRALALSSSGSALFAATPASATSLAWGPLTWQGPN
jgi:hypothetical protein